LGQQVLAAVHNQLRLEVLLLVHLLVMQLLAQQQQQQQLQLPLQTLSVQSSWHSTMAKAM
jgi:hypothetical protein